MDRPNKDEQRRTVKILEQEGLLKSSSGTVWYVIPWKWWSIWKDYVNYDEHPQPTQTDPPSPLSVEPLLDQEDQSHKTLKRDLMENIDYYLISEKLWNTLVRWYGGGPGIRRKMIETGESKELRVELYPLQLTVARFSLQNFSDQYVEKNVSRATTVRQLKTTIATRYSSPPHKARLWLRVSNADKHAKKGDSQELDKLRLLRDEGSTLEHYRVEDGQMIIFESQLPSGEWSLSEEHIEYERPSMFEPQKRLKRLKVSEEAVNESTPAERMKLVESEIPSPGVRGPEKLSFLGGNANYANTAQRRGVTGLQNLGNTCFMNSALQCLSNTAPLTRYFLTNAHKKEINRTNPLGMKGEIATQYAELIHKLWSGTYTSVAPSDFKHVLSRFAPQFSGYRQHDSQELLSFLLDGLHEDLNRVHDKPYVELKESDGREDYVVAAEAWQQHLQRNQSVIVDLFQGQLRSAVTCPDCSKISITFDPFMYLSLPLPEETRRVIKLYVFPRGGPSTEKYGVVVPKRSGDVSDLKTKVSELSGIPVSRMVVADVYYHRIYALLKDQKTLASIRDSDIIHIYEVAEEAARESDASSAEKKSHMIMVQVVQRRQSNSHYGSRLFGQPRLIAFDPKETTYSQLHEIVFRQVRGQLADQLQTADTPPQGPLPMEVEYDINSLFTLQLVDSVGSNIGNHLPNTNESIGDAFASRGAAGSRIFTLAINWRDGVKLREDKDAIRIHASATTALVGQSGLHLNDCLQLFLSAEKLGKDDEWFCPMCRQLKRATKKFDLWKMPDILVVHLKRFQYNRWWRDKISTLVTFPLEGWDLRPFVLNSQEQPLVYDLFAVSNHSGGLGGGHYTAYVKNPNDGQWYDMDDSSAHRCSSARVVSSAAYVLFYQRRKETSNQLPAQQVS